MINIDFEGVLRTFLIVFLRPPSLRTHRVLLKGQHIILRYEVILSRRRNASSKEHTFVKAIHVELPDEGGIVIVFE